MILKSQTDDRTAGILSRAFGRVGRSGRLSWTLSDQTMVSAANFLTTILLARHLGLEEFGRFTLAWSVVLTSASLHATLVIAPMTSIGPKQEADNRSAYYGALALQHLFVAAIGLILILGGGLVLDGFFPSWRVVPLLLPLALSAIAYYSYELLRRYFFVIDRVAVAFLLDGIRFSGQLAGLLILAQITQLDARIGLWIVTGSSVISVTLLASQVERLHWDRSVARSTIARHWNLSKWLTLGTSINWVGANS